MFSQASTYELIFFKDKQLSPDNFHHFIVFRDSRRDTLPMQLLQLLEGDDFVEKATKSISHSMPRVSTTMQVPSTDQSSLVNFLVNDMKKE